MHYKKRHLRLGMFLQDPLLDFQVNGLNSQFSLDPSGALGFSLDLLSIEVDFDAAWIQTVCSFCTEANLSDIWQTCISASLKRAARLIEQSKLCVDLERVV